MTALKDTLFPPLLLLTLVTTVLLHDAWPAGASPQTAPEHYISMEFDLPAGSFTANSRIVVPAGVTLGLDFGHLEVSRLVINGQQIQRDSDKGLLDISPAAAEQEILLTYTKKFPANSSPNNLISESGITLIDGWYPQADREILYKLTAVVPENFSAVSEADEIIAFEINGRKQLTFRFPHPLYSVNFIAGPYIVLEDEFGDGKKLLAYFFPEDRELAAGYLSKAKKYLNRYEEMLGSYPYARFAIVENRLPTGFAMPTFTLLGQAVVRLPFIVDTSLGHEVLHAWFGNGVRLSRQEGNWIEGLTTNLADQAFAVDQGKGAEHRKAQLVKYQSYVRPDMDLRLRDFSNVGHNVSAGQPVRAVGYNKSSMFFHMLRHRLGPDTFIASLRDFYQRSRYETAGWSDLQTSFERIAGLDLNTFFNQWLDRSDIPVITVTEVEVNHKQGYPVLHFTIDQKNDPPYDLEIPLVIRTSTEDIHKTVSADKRKNSFEVPLSSLPETLVVDPDYDLIRHLPPEELPPTWSRFLGAPEKMAILPSEEYLDLYAALLEELEEYEGHIMYENQVSDQDLAGHSLLFLGSEGDLSRSLFAVPEHPAENFTVDVRDNPLNPEQVAVLVSADDSSQVRMAAGKLRHYGKYSYLSFRDGRIQEKSIVATENGIQVQLVQLPAGINTTSSRTFAEIVDSLPDYRVIYVGEGHTSYEDHLLQLEIIRRMYRHDPKLAVGMEMFPRSSQPVLDRFVADELDEKSFLKESRYFEVWGFDYRLYRDIINFAVHKNLPLVGLNLEKKIVSQVFKEGGATGLDPEEAGRVPVDRKLDQPGYRSRLESVFLMHGDQGRNGNFGGFLQAQALWDETMAETIVKFLENNPDSRMVVIAGRGHVDKQNGIPPRVARRLDVNQAVVVSSSGGPADTRSADYIFFAPQATLAPFPMLGVMLDETEGEAGLLVTALNPQGQAQAAGIREKDIILAIGSEPVNTMDDVKIAMLYQEESDSVMVKVRRRAILGDKELEIEVPLKATEKIQHM